MPSSVGAAGRFFVYLVMIKCFMIEPIGPDDGTTILGWKNHATGEQLEHAHQFGAGAMWFAPWIERRLKENRDWSNHYHLGPDGRVLIVRTPGGDWIIDSRCSNCTLPQDNEHHCWVRHGEAPNITVDKAGRTCGAGAGSIQCGSYHGFLRDGHLVQA